MRGSYGGNSHSSNKLLETIRCSKRRIIQQILVKLKQAEPSDDSEYQALRHRQLELHEQVQSLITQVKSYATTTVALGHGAYLIGDTSRKISQPTTRSMATIDSLCRGHEKTAFDPDFPHGMIKVDTAGRELAGNLLSGVVAKLEKKLDAMITLKKEMEERENLKLDFDSAVRKLRAAKEKGKPEHIVRRDVKLQAARTALASSTEAIVKKLIYYENARSTFIYHELRQFRELQTKFFTLCASTFQMHEHPDLRDDPVTAGDATPNQEI
ncbi:hypothetical protein PINS_up008253 [Pythium insidiosum]|nr:hypothetical protein PINS_up008253 [Pythium insidiosum]